MTRLYFSFCSFADILFVFMVLVTVLNYVPSLHLHSGQHLGTNHIRFLYPLLPVTQVIQRFCLNLQDDYLCNLFAGQTNNACQKCSCVSCGRILHFWVSWA